MRRLILKKKVMRKNIAILLILMIVKSMTYGQRPMTGGYFCYYGNLHNHSNISDGSGSCDDAYNYAKNVSHQDFFSLADHCMSVSSGEWSTMKSVANQYNEDGVFVSFWGFEWSSNALYGHVTVLGSDDYCSALSFNTNSFSKLCDWVNGRNCLAFFNHPGRENDLGQEFNHFNTAPSMKFIGMELWNKGNGFNTWYYNDGYFGNDGNLGFYDEALMRNWYIGACGNEDNHDGDWGVRESKFAILANELSRDCLWESLEARRFFSTLDKNIAMSFKIYGHEMGSRLQPGDYSGVIELNDPDGEVFVKVELLRNGEIYQTFDILDNHPLIPLSNLITDHGEYYYVRATQQDGDQAISSPIFFNNQFPANKLPVVKVVYPADGASLTQGLINLTADAYDTSGNVRRVLFFVNGIYIGSDSTAPFNQVFNADSMGIYSVKCQVLDDQGAMGESEISTFEIGTGSGILQYQNDRFPEISVLATGGRYYIVVSGVIEPQNIKIIDAVGKLLYSGWILPDKLNPIDFGNGCKGLCIAFVPGFSQIKPVKFILD